MLNRIGPALELGRSFVRPEYQRQFAPLLLLWKGIGKYLVKHPQNPVLFGAVSISSQYTRASRDLMVRFFESQQEESQVNHEAKWEELVKPRRPFRPGQLRRWDSRAVAGLMKDLDELTGPISDMESDGKGAPILFKQYTKLGGKFISFNVDPKFSDALDGLVVVDVRKTDPQVLVRYMGKPEATAFLAHHGIQLDTTRTSP